MMVFSGMKVVENCWFFYPRTLNELFFAQIHAAVETTFRPLIQTSSCASMAVIRLEHYLLYD